MNSLLNMMAMKKVSSVPNQLLYLLSCLIKILLGLVGDIDLWTLFYVNIFLCLLKNLSVLNTDSLFFIWYHKSKYNITTQTRFKYHIVNLLPVQNTNVLKNACFGCKMPSSWLNHFKLDQNEINRLIYVHCFKSQNENG